MKKVVVIGSNGLLGQTLVSSLLPHPYYKVYAMASGKNRNPMVDEERYYAIDIEDLKTIKWQLNLLEPDFVINALAMTHVDACEKEQKRCKRINTDFTAQLALVCKELESHLIHISTDFIFDGKEGFYTEEDSPNPVNYYGWSKLWAEEKVRQSGVVYTILRTIVVYGKVWNMKRNNIVLWVKESLENGKAITLVDDQLRMPTYVGNLAEACLLAMDKKAVGTFHISGKDLMSIYEMGKKIATFYNLDPTLIKIIPSEKLGQPAKRSPKTGFILDKAIEKLGYKPMSFEEGLQMLSEDLINIQ